MDITAKNFNFSDIIAHFKTEGKEFQITPFGSGHINDTFLLENPNPGSPDYLLQRINNYVFKDIEGLTVNIMAVTRHLKQKLAELPDANPDKEVLTFVEGTDGKYYYEDEDHNFWRISWLLKDTHCYDVLTTTHQAYQGGLAFGRFQYLLSDLDSSLLIETIPDFLNIEKRLNDFNKAIENDKADRVKLVVSEIGFLSQRAEEMNEILRQGRAGILPLRITHNDTKFNNILLDQNNDIQCVIDLDTVMPGYVAYDFGDAIRTIINTATEDEKNLDLIQLNMPLFKAFTQGYISEAAIFLTDAELKSLVPGVLLLPYMQAVRFLTDYLDGDVYYKIHFPEHNLQRTRAQMQLLYMLEQHIQELFAIVNNEWEGAEKSKRSNR